MPAVGKRVAVPRLGGKKSSRRRVRGLIKDIQENSIKTARIKKRKRRRFRFCRNIAQKYIKTLSAKKKIIAVRKEKTKTAAKKDFTKYTSYDIIDKKIGITGEKF